MDAHIQTDTHKAVTDAAASAQAVEAVSALYSHLQQQIRQIGPVCEMSGRCCHFDTYGHRLYVTTLELAAFLAVARQTPPPTALTRRPDGGGCRFQHGKLCMVHHLRPLGCRMFYCDPRTQEPLQALFEQMHANLKRLHEEMNVPYYYLEWRQALQIIAPLLPAPAASSSANG